MLAVAGIIAGNDFAYRPTGVRKDTSSVPIDRHYETMRLTMQEIFYELGIAA